LDQNFLDPLRSKKQGVPYSEFRFKELVKECWYISSRLNTSYSDVLDLSYTERVLLIGFINDQDKATKKLIDEKNQELQNLTKNEN